MAVDVIYVGAAELLAAKRLAGLLRSPPSFRAAVFAHPGERLAAVADRVPASVGRRTTASGTVPPLGAEL